MAQTLTGNGETRAGIGHNGADIGTQEDFLALLGRWEDAAGDLAAALANCREPRDRQKKIRKLVKETYGDEGWDAFDRAVKDAKRSSAAREREAQLYAAMMAWQRRPINFQATMDLVVPAEFSPIELDRIETQGFEAGKRGDDARNNPYTTGTEAFARHHNGWLRGQAEKVDVGAAAEPKRRGRPPRGDGARQPRVARGVRSGGTGRPRGRPRKEPPAASADEAMTRAQEHLGTAEQKPEGSSAAEVL